MHAHRAASKKPEINSSFHGDYSNTPEILSKYLENTLGKISVGENNGDQPWTLSTHSDTMQKLQYKRTPMTLTLPLIGFRLGFSESACMFLISLLSGRADIK
jgi:hypothetical protein